jgi:carbamoyl-phosphate synthase large subunit
MKSVGEAMSIGRSFAESLQKALRSMETGLTGLNAPIGADGARLEDDALKSALRRPVPDRILYVAEALRRGLSIDDIYAACRIDKWFIAEVKRIVDAEARVRQDGLPEDAGELRALKSLGFSDARLAELTGLSEAQVAQTRRTRGVRPVFKRIDTCAAEFASKTPYMYSSYDEECEAEPTEARKVIILGGGPNRIGQGIEFDYCCVHAVYALREAGYETVMVNCNPETVSTDYDTSDRLYFEPLTAEDVIEIVRCEQARGAVLGVIVQFGGQTPLKLARALEAAGIPILGTSPDAIDLAEDRERFQKVIQRLGLAQPANGVANTAEEAERVAVEIKYPVLIRPSYVLGGRAMEIVHEPAQLRRYMRSAEAERDAGRLGFPVLIDSYLQDAIEVDVDALADAAGEVHIAGIMEHIEEAGIHSGDSACSLPPYSLAPATVAELGVETAKLARGLGVVGLMNVQYAVKDSRIYVLEVNPRASRTVPFVAKATGVPIAKIAARVMAGESLKALLAPYRVQATKSHIAVKEAVFPFARFPGVDIILGPEMKSTGEVMGLDTDFGRAFAKSQLGGGTGVPTKGTAFISVRDKDKPAMVALGRRLVEMGFALIATRGTAQVLEAAGIPARVINKVADGRPHIVDAMKNGEVQLVFNTSEGPQATADSFALRRQALLQKIPYYTTVAGSRAAVGAIAAMRAGALDVAPLQAYFKASF